MPQHILIIFFNISFILHNLFYFSSMEKIFNIKSPKKKILMFSIFTGLVGTFFLVLFGSMSALGYSIMLAVFSIAVMLFFKKQQLLSRIACLLSFNVHIMVARAIVAAIASVITKQSIYELSANTTSFWAILILTTVFSSLLTVLTTKIIPQKYLSQLASTTEYLFLYIAITALANIYMIANGNVYIHNITYPWLPLHQCIVAITWLLSTYVVTIMLGITSNMKKRKEKLERDSIYKHVIESRSLAVFKINLTQDRILRVSREGVKEKFPNVPYSKFAGILFSRVIHEDDLAEVNKIASTENLLSEYSAGHTFIESHARASIDNQLRWLRSSITIAKEESSEDIIAVISVSDDIHENKEKVDALIAETEKDALLPMYNKKATEVYIREHLSHKKKGALFMIDLDNFKAINDTFGHSYGDDVLLEVSEKIIHHFRSDDIVGRVGGDEFIVFIKNDTDENHLSRRAKEILQDVKKIYIKNGVSVEISCSIGIAVTTIEGLTFDDLFHKADIAMYSCKKDSKNGFVMYNGNYRL